MIVNISHQITFSRENFTCSINLLEIAWFTCVYIFSDDSNTVEGSEVSTGSATTGQSKAVNSESIVPAQTASDSVEPTVSVMECPAGEEPDGSGGCAECQSGFYKSQVGNGNCQICPQNTVPSPGTGNTACRKWVLFFFSKRNWKVAQNMETWVVCTFFSIASLCQDLAHLNSYKMSSNIVVIFPWR